MSLEAWELLELIEEQAECEWLDFKETYYSKNQKAHFFHDLLCMANTAKEGDCYIVLGVSDAKEIVGLERSVPDNEFWTDVRSFPSNYTLPISYKETTIECGTSESIVGVITIKRSTHQPFFSTKDFSKAGRTVRAGALYGRHGSNNTPIQSTLHDKEAEALWRTRLGLDVPPKQLVERLLLETENWIAFTDPNHEHSARYHHNHPEFTIVSKIRSREGSPFWEPWIERITDPFRKSNASQTTIWDYFVRYHSTTLFSGILMHPRHTIMPLPETVHPSELQKEAEEMQYILKKDTTDYFVAAILLKDRWNFDEHAEGQLLEFDYRILEDVSVMFGDPFELEERTENHFWPE